jgi:aspartate/methionine/tyrosine aminotransferase
MPKGAFYVFPNIKEYGLSSFDFVLLLLEKARVSMVPGSSFGEHGEGYVRISYAASLENLHEAMDRLEKALKEIKSAK